MEPDIEVNGYTIVQTPKLFSNVWVVMADSKDWTMGSFRTRKGAIKYANSLPHFKNKVEKNEEEIADSLMQFAQLVYGKMIGHYITVDPSSFDQDTIIRALPKYDRIPKIVPINNNADATHIEWERNDIMYYQKLYVMERNYDFLVDGIKQLFNGVEINFAKEYLGKESD